MHIGNRQKFSLAGGKPLIARIGLTLRAMAVTTCNGDDPITCRNRHCPKCQSNARDRWLDARRRELLPVPYAHVVFTVPGQLAPLALQNKSEIYGLLFRASAETLLTVARDDRHLGADIGFFSVLHTWNQKLQQNPHS